MIVIRSDSSFEIGTGHVMRCLVLAESFRAMGLEVHFVCRDLSGNITQKIEDNGFSLSLIPANSDQFDEKALIVGLKPNWIIVDHYGLDEKWEMQFNEVCPLIIIDDLGNRKHKGDYLIDQNFHKNNELYKNLVPAKCKIYMGPQFCLLRHTIRTLKPTDIASKYILVFFGGTDFTGETLKFVKAIENFQSDIKFKIVIGSKNVNYSELINFQGRHFEVIESPADWDSLLANAELYFGSGGTVTWERMFLGVPGVVVSVAENQRQIAQDLAAAEMQYYWGDHKDLDYSQIIPKLFNLFQEPQKLKKLAKKAKNFIRPFPDELLKMIFQPIGAEKFQIKFASLNDANFLLEIRNDIQTRKMFKNQDIVKLEDHKIWLSKKLEDLNSRLYIGYFEGIACGQFRVDANGFTSVSVHSKFRGKGLGAQLVSKGSEMFFLEKNDVTELYAEIKDENQSSIKSFQSAGYRLATEKTAEPGFIVLKLTNTDSEKR